MVCTGVHDELCFAFLLLSSGEQEEEALEKVSEEALEKLSGEISKELLEKVSEERSCKTGIAKMPYGRMYGMVLQLPSLFRILTVVFQKKN